VKSAPEATAIRRSPEWHGRRQFHAWNLGFSTKKTLSHDLDGVGGPEDFVATLDRVPTHNQWVMAT
jgi:hypothetical protein